MLEDLQEKYFDDIRTLLPLHRVIIFILGFTTILVCQQQTHRSIVESFLRLNIKLISFESGLFLGSAQIWHILIGVTLVISSWILSSFFTQAFFRFLLKKTKAVEKLSLEKKKIQSLLSNSRKDALDLLPYFEKQSEFASRRVRRVANFGELSTGTSICFLAAMWFGNGLDLIVSLGFLFSALASTYIAIYLFFSKYLKFDLLRSAVSGIPSELEIPVN